MLRGRIAAVFLALSFAAFAIFTFLPSSVYAVGDAADKQCKSGKTCDGKLCDYSCTWPATPVKNKEEVQCMKGAPCLDRSAGGSINVKGKCAAANVCGGKECRTSSGEYEACKTSDVKVDTSKNVPITDLSVPPVTPPDTPNTQTPPVTDWRNSVQESLLKSALDPTPPSEKVWEKSPSADSFDNLIREQLQSDAGASSQNSDTGLGATLQRWGASVFGDGNSQTLTPVDANGEAFGNPVQVQTFNPSEGTPGSTFAQPDSSVGQKDESLCGWACTVRDYAGKALDAVVKEFSGTAEAKPGPISCADSDVCGSVQKGTGSWYNCGTGGDSGPCIGTRNNPISPRDPSIASGYDLNTVVRACSGTRCLNVVSNDDGGFRGNANYDGGKRIADLSPAAFKQLAPLDQGVIRNLELTPVAKFSDYQSALDYANSLNQAPAPLPQGNPVRALENAASAYYSDLPSGQSIAQQFSDVSSQQIESNALAYANQTYTAAQANPDFSTSGDTSVGEAGTGNVTSVSSNTDTSEPLDLTPETVAYDSLLSRPAATRSVNFDAYSPASSASNDPFATSDELESIAASNQINRDLVAAQTPSWLDAAKEFANDPGRAIADSARSFVEESRSILDDFQSRFNLANAPDDTIGSALDGQTTAEQDFLESQQNIRNASNDGSVTAALDQQEYAASLYDQDRAFVNDIQNRLNSLNAEPFNQEAVDAFNRSKEIDLNKYVSAQLRSLDDQTTATAGLDQQEGDWSLYQQAKADNKEIADFTQLQLNALGSPESLTAALDQQEMFDEKSREQFIESEIAKVAGAKEPISLSKIGEDIRLANVKDGIYQFSNKGDLRGEFLVNPVTAALIPDSMKAKLHAANENGDESVFFTRKELDSIRRDMMSGSQKKGIDEILSRGGYEYTGPDITRQPGSQDLGNLSRLAEERQNWATGNYVVKSSDLGSQDAGLNEVSSIINPTAKTSQIAETSVVADAPKDFPLSDSPAIPVEGGNERPSVLTDAQVDEKVRTAFEAKIKDAQATVRYAQDLLARSESPTARLAAQTGIEEAERRLKAIEEISVAYKEGNPSPELQKVIERIRTGDDAGLFSQGLSALSAKAHSDAKAIGENMQTSVDITKPSALWEIPKMIWDGGAWGVASGVGMVADSGRNLLEKLDVVGFRADTDRELSAAIDPIGNQWKTLADVAVIAPFGTGLAKSAVGAGVDTAIDVGAVASRNAFGKVAESEAGLLVRDSAGFATTLERDAVARTTGDVVVAGETRLAGEIPGVRISQGADDFADTMPRIAANENLELRDALAARPMSEAAVRQADDIAAGASQQAPRVFTPREFQNPGDDLARVANENNAAAPRTVEPTAGEITPAPRTPADVVPEVPTTPVESKPWYRRVYEGVFGKDETPTTIPEREKVVRLADEPQIEPPPVGEVTLPRAAASEVVPNPTAPVERFDYAKAPIGIEQNIRVNPRMPEDPVFVRIENPNQGKVVTSSSDLEALKNARRADGSIQGYVSRSDYDALVAMRNDVRGVPEHISITPVKVGAEAPPQPSWLKNAADWALENPKKALAIGVVGTAPVTLPLAHFSLKDGSGSVPPVVTPPPAGTPPPKGGTVVPPPEKRGGNAPVEGPRPGSDTSNEPSPTNQQKNGGIGGTLGGLMSMLSNLFKSSQSPQPTPTTPVVKPPVTPPTTASSTKPLVTLVANPATIPSARTSRLVWSSIGADQCALFRNGIRMGIVSTKGATTTPPLSSTTSFTVRCATTAGIVGSATTTVSVPSGSSSGAESVTPAASTQNIPAPSNTTDTSSNSDTNSDGGCDLSWNLALYANCLLGK